MALPTILSLDGTGGRLAADHLRGSGTPIVYLHGLASGRDGTKGRRLLEQCADRGRELWRVDLRGHGESEGSIADSTMSGLCADVGTVLDRTGRAVIVGSSLGGLVGAWVAARDPERIAALVLIAPAFGMLEHLVGGSPLAGGDACDVTVGEHMIADARSYDERQLPSKLTMPVWIVQGALDEVVAPAATRRVFEAIPGTQKELWFVPEGDHCLERDLDEVFARIDEVLTRFCAG